MSRILILPAVLMLAGLSGCLGGGAEGDPTDATDLPTVGPVDTSLLRGDRDLRTDLEATDVIEGPQWSIGDWFGHHWFIGNEDTEGLHMNSIVVEEQGDSWFLAAEDEMSYKFEVLFDIPVLGLVAKDDLATSGFGASWDWFYQFPLTEGTAWSSTVELFGTDDGELRTYEVDFVSTYNPAINTPDGARPGFDITGTTPDGVKALEYDYVPDIGWYAHFYMYDPETEAEDDFVFHVMSMGHGSDWAGTYYYYEGGQEVLMNHFVGVDPGDPMNPDPAAVTPYTQAEPVVTFTMGSESTHLFGILGGFSFGGVQEIILVDPNNNYHQYQIQGVPFGFYFDFLDLEAVPGEWKLLAPGVGAMSGAFVQAMELTQIAVEFTTPPGEMADA